MHRMNREQFFTKLAPLDDGQLRKALWNLYWRGSGAFRQRIEAEIEPDGASRRRPARPEPADPEWVLREVREFASLARAGGYIGGDRRVSPRERPRWRFTFRRLLADARDALRGEDVATAAAAVAVLVDLACDMRSYDYFRSEDPVEAARIVVSEEVAALWGRVREHSGLPAFAAQAAPQLIRWESRYGWTRRGDGEVARRETSLATVLAPMLPMPDAWLTFADRYLEALDRVAAGDAAASRRSRERSGWRQRDRAENLAEWHLSLLQRLDDDETADRLDRLATHPALGGPELVCYQARLAHRRGQLDRARDLVAKALAELPGHRGFLAFTAEIGVP